MDTLKRLPFRAQKSVFDKLEKIVDIAAMSKEEREKYDESIRVYRDNLAMLNGAIERGFEDGLEEGLEKGMEKGIEKGRLEGKYNIVIRMKDKGLTNEIIADFTGLSIEEINKISN